MKIDKHVVHQAEITIKHLAKRIREQKNPSSSSVQALAKLAAEYRCLVEAAQKNGSTESYYEKMEAEALAEVKANMKH